VKLKVRNSQREEKTKVRAFENLEFLQVQEESAQELRRSNDNRQINQ
jgi:hypothetical protein